MLLLLEVGEDQQLQIAVEAEQQLVLVVVMQWLIDALDVGENANMYFLYQRHGLEEAIVCSLSL